MPWSNQPIATPTVIVAAGTNGAGIFVYNGTPSATSLIGAWVASGNTKDPFGTLVTSPGITLYSNGKTITANLQNSALLFEKFSGAFAPPQVSLTDDTTGLSSQLTTAFLELVNSAGSNALSLDSAGQFEYSNPAGLTMNLSGGKLASVSPVTVTQASLTNLASFTIPAKDAEVGATYRIKAFGHGTQGSTAQSLQWALSLAGTAITQTLVIPSTVFGANSTPRFWVEAELTCVTTGANATWQGNVHGSMNLLSYATATAIPFVGVVGPPGLPVQSSLASIAMAIQFAWGSTTGAPTITCDASYFERVA